MDTENFNTKLYKDVYVFNCNLGCNISIGDFSKVINSSLDDNVRIDRNNHIDSSIIGRFTYTGRNTVILHSNIGAFTSISWNVSIGGANHDYNRMTQHSFLYNSDNFLVPESESPAYDRFSNDITIGHDVWIAAGVVITRGITIGHGAVIGANSVVTKDIPPYAIAAGIPAKILKYRFDDNIIDKLLKLEWWLWPQEKIRDNFSISSNIPNTLDIDELLNDSF